MFDLATAFAMLEKQLLRAVRLGKKLISECFFKKNPLAKRASQCRIPKPTF
jgi:hypothetical protein